MFTTPNYSFMLSNNAFVEATNASIFRGSHKCPCSVSVCSVLCVMLCFSVVCSVPCVCVADYLYTRSCDRCDDVSRITQAHWHTLLRGYILLQFVVQPAPVQSTHTDPVCWCDLRLFSVHDTMRIYVCRFFFYQRKIIFDNS